MNGKVVILLSILIFIAIIIKIYNNIKTKKLIKKADKAKIKYENEDICIINNFNYYCNELIVINYPKEDDYYSLKSTYEPIYNYYEKIFKNPYFAKISKEFSNLKIFLEMYKKNFILKSYEVRKNEFIEKEIEKTKEFLSNIDGKSLDYQQRKAVITGEDNSLVIAGAGSGKTLTISAKVKYLIERKNVNPKDILLITFTTKACNEMEERIVEKLGINVDIKTFHSLGYDILGFFMGKKPDVSDYVEKITREFMGYSSKIQNLSEDIFKYFALYINDSLNYEDFQELGDFYKAIIGRELTPIKDKIEYLTQKEMLNEMYEHKKKSKNITYKMEKVKSLEELQIANYLFLNGINYEYEKKYEKDISDEENRQYKPDFYLKDYGIYLEHFGITKDGKCPQYCKVEEKKYLADMEWKRECHEKYGTKLVETYSWESKEGILFDKLDKIIRENNIKVTKITNENFTKHLELLNKDNEIIRFYNLLNAFLNLFKSNNYKLSDLENMKEKALKLDKFLMEKHTLFLKIFTEYYNFYESKLKEKKIIDFNDMINYATEYIENSELNDKFDYKYIIIDEFQDISNARYKLIKSIKNKSNSQIMAVGDDWQSIYRFAGSEIAIFTKFEEYFGKSEILRLENTYRNSQELLTVASEFIMKNPYQIVKKLKSGKNLETPVKIIYYNENKDNGVNKQQDALLEQLLKLLKYINNQGIKKDILILGRNNFDIDVLKNTDEFKIQLVNGQLELKSKNFPNLRIIFLTIHKSKGLEADEVIVINNKNDMKGFPNKMIDDSVLEYVIKSDELFNYEEERRLFYVALTRTKNYCYLLTPQDESLFINEIKHYKNVKYFEVDGDLKISCPLCKTGHLIKKVSKKGKEFMSCSNYPCCTYSILDLEILNNERCQLCDSGFMVLRRGKFGTFYGCSNYPFCNHTIDIKDRTEMKKSRKKIKYY